MVGRQRQWVALCALVTALALAWPGTATSSPSVSQRAAPDPAVAKFPQNFPPIPGSGLTRVGHKVYFVMANLGGNTKIGRIGAQGSVRLATVKGPAYDFNAPTRASDGAIWVVTDASEAGGKGISLGGLDPATWEVQTANSSINVMGTWPTVADPNGRFWAQGNVVNKGISVLGDGLSKSRVVVNTKLGPISSGVDFAISNPIMIGPDNHVWMLGGEGFGADLRIVSVGPNGLRVVVTPNHITIGTLALTRGKGRVWTVGHRGRRHLVAIGVDPQGNVTRVRTDMSDECLLDSAKPVVSGGDLWFTGADASCAPTAGLLMAEVPMAGGAPVVHDTGMTILGEYVSTVLPVDGAVLAAGYNDQGKLAFARVTDSVEVVPTSLQPWVDSQQGRYPIVSDQNGGAWAQGLNAKGKLVVVHVEGTTVTKTATGLLPVARELSLGPDQSLWTQGLHQGKLVLVKVAPDGTLVKYQTGLAPTDFAVKPTADGLGNLWFQGTRPSDGNLVLVRVAASD